MAKRSRINGRKIVSGAAWTDSYLRVRVHYDGNGCIVLSKKAKKTEGLEQHKKLQREKDQKRKERKQVSLPSKHQGKGKK